MFFKLHLLSWKIDLAVIICLFVPLTLAFEYKPHSNCTFSSAVPNRKVEMNCPQLINFDRYIWPKNFNVYLLQSEITRLDIHTGMIMSDFAAIPPRDKLIDVRFQHFNLESGDMRFPLNTLLSNLKSAIEILYLHSVKLSFLDAADLSGFQNLRELTLYDCQITSISKSAFDEVGIPIPGTSPIQFTSQVASIHFGSNKLETLDWSFLRPISKSVEMIWIYNNPLRSENLTCSVPFAFQNVEHIDLNNNQLRWIPADVFETFNGTLPMDLYLHGSNKFCQKTTDCSCCEMWPFIKWMRKDNKISNIKGITCGTTNPNILPTMTTPDFQHCQDIRRTSHSVTEQMQIIELTGLNQAPSVAGLSNMLQLTELKSAVSIPLNQSRNFDILLGGTCLSALTVGCFRGKLTFSDMDFDNRNALTVVLSVDGTNRCRTIMYSAHRYLLRRQKRDISRSISPLAVLCRDGTLHISDTLPDESEATKLIFTTTGHLRCRLIFFEFLNYVFSFMSST